VEGEFVVSGELEKLAERVEGLSGPDREVDAAIALASGWRVCRGNWWTPDQASRAKKARRSIWSSGSPVQLPAYTASLDAAMTLVPEGLGLHINRYWTASHDGPVWSCEISTGGLPNKPRQVFDCYDAAGPAQALTAASLRARAASLTMEG